MHRTSKERYAQIMRLHRTGLSTAEIAARLEVSTRTVERARSAAGVCRPPHVPTEWDKLRAKELLEDGANYEEVARTIGFWPRAIKHWHPGYALTKTEVGQLSRMAWRMRQLERVTQPAQ